MNKIAVLVDSGCNLPDEIATKQGLYTVPLKMNYSEGTFRDGVDITPKEVYDRLEQEIPTTSLPSQEEVAGLFEEMKQAGYTQAICIHISSNLSGTFNIVRLAAEEGEGLEVRLVDTKNIGVGSGFFAIYAQQLIAQGLSLEVIGQKLEEKVEKSHVFFCVDTLKYLQKGGRIGLVGSIVGTTLGLKPIISCNPDGIYYTVAKVRGKHQAVKKMMELVEGLTEQSKHYDICFCHGGAYDEFEEFLAEGNRRFQTENRYFNEISPTLGVHTGPGLLGIGVFLRDE